MMKYKNDDEMLRRLSYVTIQNAASGIVWFDPEGRINHVNETLCKMLGYSREELLNLSVYDLAPDYRPELFWDFFKSAEGGTDCFESWAHTKNGRSFPTEVTVTFTEFEGETYVCTFVRDITERKRRENKLKNALDELEEIKKRLEAENVYLQEEIKVDHNFSDIVGQSKAFKEVLNQVKQVAAADATVLILGETGTGKELLARAIHNLSPRKNRPLVKVNCAALPANLIESELFGHEKGAFTGAVTQKVGRFELADHGTIFLDEIGDLPMELQAKLLRVLQEGEFERVGGTKTIKVEVRVIAATNRDLEEAMDNGTFREDLFYRLNVFPIQFPPLRERKKDIPVLVNHFIRKYASKMGKGVKTVSKSVMEVLQEYHWPGNVRELENIIERSLILSQGDELTVDDCFRRPVKTSEKKSITTLTEMERDYILEALDATGWRVSGRRGAAELLGLKPTTLEARMKKLGIRRKGS